MFHTFIRLIVTLWFGFSSFFVVPYAQADGLPQSSFEGLKQTESGKVGLIIDPLTIQLKDQTVISLIGLDIPDQYIRGGGPLSLAAMTILDDMLFNEAVRLYQTPDPKVGRLNRMNQQRAHIERVSDNAWVQGTLLRLGLARVTTTPSNPEMLDEMMALEQDARDEGIGLWSDPDYTIKNAANFQGDADSFHIVEGKIISTAMKKNRIYINFGSDWRSDFTVSIPPEHRRDFTSAGLDPLSWNGLKIRVRGWVEDYNGPLIEITHPGAIEFLDQTD